MHTCCQVSKLTLHDTASHCTPGQPASLALLTGAPGAGICRLRPPTGPTNWQRQPLHAGRAPGAGDCFRRNALPTAASTRSPLRTPVI